MQKMIHDQLIGEGATAIQPSAATYAEKFLGMLPVGLPEPEVDIEPDEEIGFEWNRVGLRRLVIRFSPTGKIGFSQLDGTSLEWGSDPIFESGVKRAIERVTRFFASRSRQEKEKQVREGETG